MATPIVYVRVSVASMLQRFHGCEPGYIRDVCHGRCCDAPSRPGGSMVTIHPLEQGRIEARGGRVLNGLLVTEAGCTFKTDEHLCGLHHTPDKPFGCIASPFTLNATDCLIVRNRYRRLPCYDTPEALPAYRAFDASLRLIFGDEEATYLARALDIHEDRRTAATAAGEPWAPEDGGRFLRAPISGHVYDILHENDLIKKSSGKS